MSLDNDTNPTRADEDLRAPAAAGGRYEPAIPRTKIRRSPFNHRKTFTGLEDLADSIRAHGILNPLIVRPAPLALGTGKKAGKVDPADFELVAGERRWRAAELAELELLPCIVRELSDVEVLEIQLIENVQRADVHPLEEADGYRDLMEKHGYTVDAIVTKTGKSKATVYARLKLCDLSKEARDLFLEEKLQPSIALLIARIPDEKLQSKAVRAVLGKPDEDDDRSDLWDRPHFEVEDEKGKPRAEPIPMSVREATAYIQRRFMLRLEDASFDPADAELVPAVGACSKCVFRTGNQPTLFGDVKGADVCTKPSCYDAKTDANWKLRAGAARAAGLKVLDKDESQKIFNMYGDATKVTPHGTPYVDPKAEIPYELLSADQRGKKPPTWEKVLGKKGLEKVKSVLAQDGTGAARTLLDKKSAAAVAVELGKVEVRDKAGPDPKEKAAAARDKKRHAMLQRAVYLAIEFCGKEAAKGIKKELELWEWLLLAHEEGRHSYDAEEKVMHVHFGDEAGAHRIDELVGKAEGVAARALVVELMVAGVSEGAWHRDDPSDEFLAALALFGQDWKKLKSAAAELLEHEAKANVDPTKCPAKREGPCQLPKGHAGDHRHERPDGSGSEWSAKHEKNIAGVGASHHSWPAPKGKGGKKGAAKR